MNKSHGIVASIVAIPCLFLGMVFHGCHAPAPVGPGPGPDDGKARTGNHVVFVIDLSAINLPQAIILDSPRLAAMKLDGKCSIVGLKEADSFGYSEPLAKAGGAPAMLVMNDDAEDNCVYPGRMPTDQNALEQLLTKYVAGLPPPAKARPAYEVYPNQSRDTVVKKAEDGQEYIETGGHRRMLTARSDAVKFGALPKYSDHYPVYPIAEWRETNRSAMFSGKDWIFDQDGHGSCVGNGWVGALRRCRVLWGMKDVNLSPAYLYSWINGGKDEGAIISDGIAALTKHGTCSFDLMGQDPIYRSGAKGILKLHPDADDEAARYKLGEAYRVTSWEELCSSIQTGLFLPVYGYMVGNNFEHFSKDGCAGHDRGPGNHCNFGQDLKRVGDKWVIDDVNSWQFGWGPFKNGHVYLDKNHLFGGGDQPDVCVIRAPARDPKEPFAPPTYRPKKKAA